MGCQPDLTDKEMPQTATGCPRKRERYPVDRRITCLFQKVCFAMKLSDKPHADLVMLVYLIGDDTLKQILFLLNFSPTPYDRLIAEYPKPT